jgi:hypothetical protein
MLKIRNLVLDGVALLGIAMGVIAGLGGFTHGVLARAEHAVSAIEKLDVQTTGSIPHSRAP